jgi:hypothetical protein
MHMQLILADNCDSCHRLESMWRSLCVEYHWNYEALHIQHNKKAQELAEQLQLVTFPALLVDGVVKAVGSHNKQEALAILGVPARTEPKL